MNIAQKTKFILVGCLLWALPLTTLPRVAAKPNAAAPSQTLAAAPSLPSPCHAAAGAGRRRGHTAHWDGGGGAPPTLAIWWRR